MPLPPRTVSAQKIPPGKALNFAASPAADSSATVEVLLIAHGGGTRALFTQAFENSNWHLEPAATPADALLRLRENPMAIVIYEDQPPPMHSAPPAEAEPHEAWLDLLEQTRSLRHPPKVIVASRRADDRMWAEVLHQGGYDVLPLPLDAAEVVRTVSMAWLEWRHERESAPAARTLAASAAS